MDLKSKQQQQQEEEEEEEEPFLLSPPWSGIRPVTLPENSHQFQITAGLQCCSHWASETGTFSARCALAAIGIETQLMLICQCVDVQEIKVCVGHRDMISQGPPRNVKGDQVVHHAEGLSYTKFVGEATQLQPTAATNAAVKVYRSSKVGKAKCYHVSSCFQDSIYIYIHIYIYCLQGLFHSSDMQRDFSSRKSTCQSKPKVYLWCHKWALDFSNQQDDWDGGHELFAKGKATKPLWGRTKTYLCPSLAKSIKKNSTPWYRRCKISSVSNNWIWVFLDEKRSTERHGFLFEHGSDSAIPFGMTMEPVS
jgi:hypothetical protein